VSANVLHLIGSFHLGGSERQGLQLTRLLKESGNYRLHLATLDRSGPLCREAEALDLGDIPEYRLTGFHDRNMFTQVQRFARFLREHEIDVVQTHDFYTNIFGMAASRWARVPARVASRRETAGWRTGAQTFVERQAYRLAHAIVANAEAVRAQLIKEGVGSEKIATVYNGLDLARVSPPSVFRRDDVMASLNLPRGAPHRFVTIVANLHHPVKDHPTFLRAASRVREKCPDARFIIAGEGALTDSMRQLAAVLAIETCTSFVGRCDRIPELLAVSDVCVLSSTAEGFSNSILEYMAASRPVVVTDVGGAREAVVNGVSGYIVPAGDDDSMANRIIALLEEPESARAMGERGRQIVEEKFSCKAQLERTETLYEKLLGQRRRALANTARQVQASPSEGASQP